MKHVKLGSGLLVVLLIIGLLLTACLSGLRTQLCSALDTAAAEVLSCPMLRRRSGRPVGISLLSDWWRRGAWTGGKSV